MSANTEARTQDVVWRRRTPMGDLLAWGAWLAIVLATVLSFRQISDATIWDFVWDAPQQGADLLSRAVPPRWSYASVLWKPLWDTVNMATLGTLLAVILGIPVAVLAARNTTPSVLLVRPLALFVIVASRSINSLIWALVLVVIIGPGPLAGTLAIALRSVGFIGKLLYEAIEEIDPVQVEAVEATGATRAQVLSWGILPQVAPAIAGIGVFRWDINIREATVLGLVGAGGIGLQLEGSVATLAWPQVSVILLLILATVVVSEWVSARVRKAIT
ncbi:phosphonate ABC transporter, permease protein PhnE [Roseomonas aerophila]|uniref:Phosphonate ABC transporter, permease protein PhnE n=1 Tax=Teichococcus aerophilus TaxID=1224513 RepID=A0ABR7RKJ7_9PROT|nr:phosphonate ABC transporter, permease protein PhnE [Pseudoroseomonas aerophila]MBC9207105.1 phosphonate ABC transporter, permease protein PhnE [Pseudoroseomonas aerophila]